MSAGRRFEELVRIMAELRGPKGCPWDKEQSPQSIQAYCLEEAYEVVEALDEGDAKKLCEELGDLLLQVVFHAQFGSEQGTFTISNVIDGICEKLIRRHPHVFESEAQGQVSSAKDVLNQWSEIKKKEGREHLLDGIPRALPALLRGKRVGEKAATVGFDFSNASEVWKKVEEEMAELRAASAEDREEEMGDLLFALTSLSRQLQIDPEASLRKATEKFERRFRKMEEACKERNLTMTKLSASELDRMWREAKERLS